MNSNELHLNNWITDGRLNMKVCGILEDTIHAKVKGIGEYHLNIFDVQGIPITVQILDKCLKNINGVSWGSKDFTIADSDGIWDIYCNHTFIRVVEYLHELQNGYAWIMQKELEVEL